MPLRFWIVAGCSSVLHFGLWLFLVMATFSTSMRRFDDPAATLPSAQERAMERGLEVLGLPLLPLMEDLSWSRWRDVLEWPVLFANSLMWGIAIAILFSAFFACSPQRVETDSTDR